jgi:hypothetical protein
MAAVCTSAQAGFGQLFDARMKNELFSILSLYKKFCIFDGMTISFSYY